MKIATLSGQACLAIVRGRLIRTKRYHDYKKRIAANIGAEMMLTDTQPAPRGTLYRVEIGFSCKGWGVDTDNAAKAVLDAMIGVCIDDDRGVIELEIKKETHSKKEELQIVVYKIGSRPVATPVKKRTPNKVTSDRAKPVRARRTKTLGGARRKTRKRF